MVFDGNLLVLLAMIAAIFSGVFICHNRGYGMWFLCLFNSRDTQVQLHLYFGMVAVFSLFFYTAYAAIVRSFAFDMVSLGKGIGITFAGIGLSSVGNGLQVKADASVELTSPPAASPPAAIDTALAPLFARLCDPSDATMEMHLFLGAIAIIILILYTGYDLAFMAKDFQPFSYGQAMAFTFAGVGVASWGQGIQRKLQQPPPAA